MTAASWVPESLARRKVLVVDDEANLLDLVRGYLEAEGFSVLTASDGLSALGVVRSELPDLVVLDVMLPGLDGIETCRRLRRFSDAYVLMLSARAEETDKIVGLSVGADDYLTKPFSPRELVARVKAMLRRPRTTPASPLPATDDPGDPWAMTPPLHIGDLEINMPNREVLRRGKPVHLTRREFDLLAALAAHPGRVFTRNQLVERIWGDNYFDDHMVDVHVSNLREKLEDDPSSPRFIETVRGVGYRFARET